MAAQVEVQTGEVGRAAVGGRLHLSPLADSSNSLVEMPSLIGPGPDRAVPGPKPRLTPKPFAVERNPTIKPILAPKPQTRPRPESTRLPGHKPELPSAPKPQQPAGKPKAVSTAPNRPAALKTANKLISGQTAKPVVQPFKPAPPLDPGDPRKPAERQKPGSLAYSHSLKKLPSAEWSGTTQRDQDPGASMTRAKSLGFLAEVGQEEEAKPEAAAALRPQPRSLRPRPVSAIFLDSPAKTETPLPATRRVTRRPLSADLTSKFESIGLSLHRRTPRTSTKENAPEEPARTPKTPTPLGPEGADQPAGSDQSSKKAKEGTSRDGGGDKPAASIRSRISLLLDSSPSPGAAVQGSEPAVGVKQLIKQLTEDTTPTQSPVLKPPLKSRPLPLDLTKR